VLSIAFISVSLSPVSYYTAWTSYWTGYVIRDRTASGDWSIVICYLNAVKHCAQ